MTAIIFSRNRAMQLDALLASIQQYAATLFDNVYVLYRTDPIYTSSYEMLKERWKGTATFVQRTNLKIDTLHALQSAGEWCCFLTDDDVFYRPVTNSFLKELTEDVLCMSLRLGLNTIYCYPANCIQPLPEHSYCQDELMKWNWTIARLDFGYPFSIDGHVFRTRDLINAVESVEFQTPTEFEDRWQRTNLTGRCYMLSCLSSRLVNIPANIVQTMYLNRHEGGSVQTLNDKYLTGYAIDTDAMDFSSVCSAHSPIQLVFKKG